MNNVFDFRRFGKYFTYDLVNAKNNYWLSLLITGLLPVISYVISQMLGRLFTGEWYQGALATQISSFCAAIVVVSMGFSAKAYGRITERRAGSSWLMIPASSFEKFLSMIIISCVVVPVLLGILLFGSDALMSLIIPSYGKPLFYYVSNVNGFIAEELADSLSLNVPALIAVSWASSILPFLLGAIFFKKSKVGKTFLALIGLSIVLSMISSVFMNGLVLDVEDLFCLGGSFTGEEFFRRFNLLMNILSTVSIGTLLVLIYLRVRTIKL